MKVTDVTETSLRLSCGHGVTPPGKIGDDIPCMVCDYKRDDLTGINHDLAQIMRTVYTCRIESIDIIDYAQKQLRTMQQMLETSRRDAIEIAADNVTPTMGEDAADHLYNTLYPNKHEVSRGAHHDRIMGIGFAPTMLSRQCVYCKRNLTNEEPQHHWCVCPWLVAHNALVASFPSWFAPELREQVQGVTERDE